MPKVHSLDFVFLETSIFGVNQGYTGRFIRPSIAWILGIFNLCYSLTITYLILSGGHFNTDSNLWINYTARKLYFFIALITIVIVQIRYLFRRQQMAPVSRELDHLYKLSTWRGDIYGCTARIMLYLGRTLISQYLPVYANSRIKNKGWSTLVVLFKWVDFIPTVTTEFIGQAMLLFQHEFKVLSKTTEGLAIKKYYGMSELRALNRRHASLFALFNRVTQCTGVDNLLIIESERLLILINLFVNANLNMLVTVHWTKWLLDCVICSFRVERITHYCFRGQRIIIEADRFPSTLDEIDSLNFANDESSLEIFRKQVRLRKLEFNCNRILKLDMKLFFHILKDLITLFIILLQLTTNPVALGTSEPANATESNNVTEYFRGFSNM